MEREGERERREREGEERERERGRERERESDALDKARNGGGAMQCCCTHKRLIDYRGKRRRRPQWDTSINERMRMNG